MESFASSRPQAFDTTITRTESFGLEPSSSLSDTISHDVAKLRILLLNSLLVVINSH